MQAADEFDYFLDQLSFFCSRSIEKFKYQMYLITLPKSFGVSLMGLFRDERIKSVGLLHQIISIPPLINLNAKSVSFGFCFLETITHLTIHFSAVLKMMEYLYVFFFSFETNHHAFPDSENGNALSIPNNGEPCRNFSSE